MRTKLSIVVVALVMFMAATQASAYTNTTYTQSQCSGGASVGTLSNEGYNPGCVAYCASLTASCCSTTEVMSELYGSDTYTCQAYTGSTSIVQRSNTYTCTGGGGGYDTAQNDDGDLVANVLGAMQNLAVLNGGGGEYCTYNSYWADTLSYAAQPTAALVTNPTSINTGQSALITWSSTNATSCTGTNFSTGNATSG